MYYYIAMAKRKFKVNFGKKSIILTVVFLVLVAADLLTKQFKDEWLVVIIRNFFEIDGSIPNNPGCAFSFLNQHPEVGQPILITLTFVLLAVIITIFLLVPERYTLTKISLTLISAGAVGNLVDRLALREVRDFIGLNMFGNMVYCNLADFFIVIGTILVVIDVLFINDWAVFPLTKSAREAQKERKARAEEEKAEAKNLPQSTAEEGEINGEADAPANGEILTDKLESDDISQQNDEISASGGEDIKPPADDEE